MDEKIIKKEIAALYRKVNILINQNIKMKVQYELDIKIMKALHEENEALYKLLKVSLINSEEIIANQNQQSQMNNKKVFSLINEHMLGEGNFKEWLRIELERYNLLENHYTNRVKDIQIRDIKKLKETKQKNKGNFLTRFVKFIIYSMTILTILYTSYNYISEEYLNKKTSIKVLKNSIVLNLENRKKIKTKKDFITNARHVEIENLKFYEFDIGEKSYRAKLKDIILITK